MLRWLLLTMTVLVSLTWVPVPASADPQPAEQTVGELDLRGQWG